MRGIYTFMSWLILISSLPFLLPLSLLKGYGVRGRLGFLPQGVRRNGIWLHGASIGEVSMLVSLAKRIESQAPLLPLSFSATTQTGLQRARSLFPNATPFLLPLDLPPILAKLFNSLRPKALIIAESELWPNLIYQAKLRGCPIFLVNARLSPSSKYKLLKSLFPYLFDSFTRIFCREERDKRGFEGLGVKVERLTVVGELKFDRPQNLSLSPKLREDLGIGPEEKVLVAGCTRNGEEEKVLQAFSQADSPQATLILAPRHLDRLEEVERILKREEFDYIRRSQASRRGKERVILLDTYGELSSIYSICYAAFIGGSLEPFGGHNPLEPASFGVPVIFGPYMQGNPEGAEVLLREGGGIMVRDEDELAQVWRRLLRDPQERERRGKSAQKALVERSGRSEWVAQIILKEIGIGIED